MPRKLFILWVSIAVLSLQFCSHPRIENAESKTRDSSRNRKGVPEAANEEYSFAGKSAPLPSHARPPAKKDLPGRFNPDFNTENYSHIVENKFLDVKNNPLSTFSADVDTASYANMRRFLNEGTLPPKDSIRIEEMINYFSYSYPSPSGIDPFSITTEVAESPWNQGNKLLLIGLKGKNIEKDKMPPRNLVFLLDVSGSMMDQDKLPLLVQSLKMLTNQLSEKDKVSIVVYAGASGLVLPATSGINKNKIIDSLESLEAGGSTNGGAGIELAYKIAGENFKKDGINRVILATDGDFNVGVTNEGDLIRLIEKKRESGIFLTVLGFGSGNLKDSAMEKLADKGNGNYAYIDTISEANKVLVNEAGSTLVAIAKDVKLQIEFNPAHVQSYRLIGYENRIMAAEDFNDDKKDAGEIGAGHNVTALYEIVPAGTGKSGSAVDPLKYQKSPELSAHALGKELATVKFRYKEPNGSTSKLLSRTVFIQENAFEKSSENLRFAAGVAAFGMILRNSEFKGQSNFTFVKSTVRNASSEDKNKYRSEFLSLVEKAEKLMKN